MCLVLLIFQLFTAFSEYSLRTYIFESRYIAAKSMTPTLQLNDRLIIDKLVYHFAMPKRGDIIIFNPTARMKEDNFQDPFIKRIIGLPEETIEVKNGQVYINNQPLEENYIAEAPEYEYGPSKIPSNSYFVLGDNRNNSYDSHYWGFVPKDLIIGKATKIYWPPKRSGIIK